MEHEKKINTLPTLAWCLFDWAVSPFSVLITTFIFATYFTQKVAPNVISGTQQWADANALAGLIAAILSPILGSIADYEGRRKPWLLVFVVIIFISSTCLWFVQPHASFITTALFWIVIGTISIEVCSVFYNAMLDELAPPQFLGRLSGWGWGCGYLGGLCALIIALGLFVLNDGRWFGLNAAEAEQIRICGPLVAIWLALFSWPIFVWTPDRPSTGLGLLAASQKGWHSLWNILHLLRSKYKNIFIFLIARMIYIDGLITIFAFGGIYAAGVFHMTMTEVIEFGIGMNLMAGIGAAIFGWLDDKRGPKITILITLLLMIACGAGIVLIHSKLWFWILGMGLSLGVGPVQAASRSLLIRISPSGLMTEIFGFYTLSGRATSFMGPWILGLITAYFHSQRIGMSTTFLFMAAGGILLLFVTIPPQRPVL